MSVKLRIKRILLTTFVLLILLLLVTYFLVVRPSFPASKVTRQNDVVRIEALRQTVIHLSEYLSPRDYTNLENLNATADYIKNEFSQLTDKVSYQTYVVDNQEYKNVVARFGPENGSMIVIGAHYDVADPLPGADDNASGVAGLLELARLLSKNKLTQPIELVAYTLEEPPFFAGKKMGSYIHANSVKNKNVELMISLEMIGYFTNEADSQKYPLGLLSWFYPSRGNFIAVIDQVFSNAGAQLKKTFKSHTELPVYSMNAPASLPGVDFSDHRNYWLFDIPAIMVTDTAFFRNTNYHTAEDTFEKLDYDAMSEVVYGVYQHIIKLQ
jgi:Zn-dependent M28 family amino/carboxypeptidase